MRRWTVAVGLALLAVMITGVACGGDDEEMPTTGTPTIGPTPTAQTTPQTTATPTASPISTPTPEQTSSPTATPTGAEPADVDACELVTDDFVGRIFGRPVESVDRGLGGEGGPKDVCYYHFDESSEVILRVIISDGEAYYDRAAFGEEVSGLGDQANWNEGARTLLVLQNGNGIEVAISPSVLPGASLDVLFEIAKSMAVDAIFSGLLPN